MILIEKQLAFSPQRNLFYIFSNIEFSILYEVQQHFYTVIACLCDCMFPRCLWMRPRQNMPANDVKT